MRASAHHGPVRKLIVVGVRVVKETAFFDDQPPGIHAWAITAVPAQGAAPNCAFEGCHGTSNVLALIILRQPEHLDPPPTVAANVIAPVRNGPRSRLIPFERDRASIDGNGDSPLVEQTSETPEPHSAAVLVG